MIIITGYYSKYIFYTKEMSQMVHMYQISQFCKCIVSTDTYTRYYIKYIVPTVTLPSVTYGYTLVQHNVLKISLYAYI